MISFPFQANPFLCLSPVWLNTGRNKLHIKKETRKGYLNRAIKKPRLRYFAKNKPLLSGRVFSADIK